METPDSALSLAFDADDVRPRTKSRSVRLVPAPCLTGTDLARQRCCQLSHIPLAGDVERGRVVAGGLLQSGGPTD